MVWGSILSVNTNTENIVSVHDRHVPNIISCYSSYHHLNHIEITDMILVGHTKILILYMKRKSSCLFWGLNTQESLYHVMPNIYSFGSSWYLNQMEIIAIIMVRHNAQESCYKNTKK